MVVLLPKAKDGLPALEKELGAELFLKVFQGLNDRTPTKTEVTLPRFKITQSCMLKDVLTKLGMGIAFGGEADFSGMTGNGDLQISQVFHKAFWEGNEEGTEAAGATAVIMSKRAVMFEAPPVFRADHPFIFVIRHRPTDSVLFMGRIADPSCP